MSHRLFLTAATSAAAFAAFCAVAPAAGTAVAAGPAETATAAVSSLPRLAPLPPPMPQESDKLTVSVTNLAADRAKGTYELKCGPAGGSHPEARAACDRLAELARRGPDPFARVPADTTCTMLYGGPATAHVTGVWQGRSIDADFNRKNGCEISRWDNLKPVLPSPEL